LKGEIEKEVLDVIRLSQRKFGGDPFEWELIARKKFMTVKAYQNYNWPKRFKRANVDVTVTLRIDNFGKQRTPYIKTGRETG